MRFSTWYAKQPRGTSLRLEREHKIGHSTTHRLSKGGVVRDYQLAVRISAATDGQVRVRELVEAPKPRKRGVR